MSKLLKQLLALVVVASAVIACSSTKAPTNDQMNSSAPVASAPVASAPQVEASAPQVSNHNSVYFGFNKYDINDDYSGVVKTNAQYLSSSNQAQVQVQGNTDDIGSVEYNLALGQKRADTVKQALVANGANSSQIEAISYGKLKAKYSNSDDASRAQNRRSDIVYKSNEPKGYSVDANGLPMVDGSFYNGTVTEGVQ